MIEFYIIYQILNLTTCIHTLEFFFKHSLSQLALRVDFFGRLNVLTKRNSIAYSRIDRLLSPFYVLPPFSATPQAPRHCYFILFYFCRLWRCVRVIAFMLCFGDSSFASHHAGWVLRTNASCIRTCIRTNNNLKLSSVYDRFGRVLCVFRVFFSHFSALWVSFGIERLGMQKIFKFEKNHASCVRGVGWRPQQHCSKEDIDKTYLFLEVYNKRVHTAKNTPTLFP